MSSSSKWSGRKIELAEDITPNLIPMVDIMFLLLLFLMLGADMAQQELEDVKLAMGTHVKADGEGKVVGKRLTINVYHLYSSGAGETVKCDDYDSETAMDTVALNTPLRICRNMSHWRLAIRGEVFKAATDKKFVEILKSWSNEGKKNLSDRVSESTVFIRVDKSAPYILAQSVMNAAAFVGMYKIEVGAASKTQEGPTR
jgi:biopolymer transport protein ExbD